MLTIERSSANFLACGDAKRRKANDAVTTSNPAAAPVIEHRGDRPQSCEESTAWSREDTLQHVIRSILPLQQPGVFLNEIQDYIIEKGKRLDASQYNNCRSTKTKIHRTLTEMLREKEIEREVAKTANGRESHRYILPRRDEPTESRSTKYWTDENLINQGSGQNTEASTLRGNEVSHVQGRTKSPRGAVYIDVRTTHGIDSSPTETSVYSGEENSYTSMLGGSFPKRIQTLHSAELHKRDSSRQPYEDGIQSQAAIPGPHQQAQMPDRVEAAGVKFPISRDFRKPGEQGSIALGSEQRAQMVPASAGAKPQKSALKQVTPQRADSSRSDVESDTQSFVARPLGDMDTEGWEPQIPRTQSNCVKQKSPPDAIGHATKQTMGSQSIEGSQTDVQTLHTVTGSCRNGLESSRAADSHVDSCPTDHNVPHYESRPATSNSTQHSNTFQQTLCQSFPPPSGAPISGTTGPRLSNAAVTQSAQNLGQSCSSPERCFDPQQRSEFTSSRQRINRSDKSEVFQPVVTEEADKVDMDVHTLGKQVKLARDIKAKREKLAEGMRDLESRRRDAHLSLRTSLAEMDADIREHVRLSSNLERLQNLTEKREHEAAAILQRLDSRRDMASRIREEHQSHTNSIRRMESEFSSSGKELQGILQTLGILL